MKKRLFFLYFLCLFCTLLLAGCKKNSQVIDPATNPNYNKENYLTGLHYAQMDIDGYGSIILELDADAAPATVTNFVNLIQDGFYNGLTFHRIINGFVMQGGDPERTGIGGSRYTVPGEFELNDVQNPISHVRGTISMARADDNYNSASSQFFIVHQDATALDGSYAAFGKVLLGMNVVDTICSSVPVIDNNGTVTFPNQPVINSIVIIEPELIEAIKQQENTTRPDPTAKIIFTPISSTEGLTLKDTWTIDADGTSYLLFSSEDLASLGIYKTDLSSGMSYDSSDALAFIEDLGANEYISVKITIPEETLPSLMIVAEEPSGAIGQHLLYYDEYFGGAYLVPVLN